MQASTCRQMKAGAGEIQSEDEAFLACAGGVGWKSVSMQKNPGGGTTKISNLNASRGTDTKQQRIKTAFGDTLAAIFVGRVLGNVP